jgi:hypothetical protein
MSYSIDTNTVIELLFSKLRECNEIYLAVDEWLSNSDEYEDDNEIASRHVEKVLLKAQMQGIREEINKLQNMEIEENER